MYPVLVFAFAILIILFLFYSDARSMAKDVHNIILDVIQELGQKTKSEAEAYIKKMESQRRYSADVWS